MPWGRDVWQTIALCNPKFEGARIISLSVSGGSQFMNKRVKIQFAMYFKIHGFKTGTELLNIHLRHYII